MTDTTTIRDGRNHDTASHGGHHTLTRRVELIAIGLLLLLLAPPHAVTRGQAMVNSGHALDNNLRLGSGGYNGAVRGGGRGESDFQRDAFNAVHGGIRRQGMNPDGLTYSQYRGGIDRYNAFRDERAYTPHRWTRVTGQRAGAAPAPAAAPAGRPAGGPGVAVSNTAHAGFSQSFDPGYEAGLAEPQYESETAQQQANTLSYGIGFAIGEKIRAVLEAEQVDAELSSMVSGFRDAVQDNPPRMQPDEMEELLQALQKRLTEKRTGERLASDPEFRSQLERNEASAEQLRARLASDAEVVTLDNGLQYKVLVEGTGDKPTENDMVTVIHRLLTPQGEYASDPMRRAVVLRQSLEGVVITLTSMRVGSVWRVAIPSKLAHGLNGRPPLHGPGVTLYMEVELVSIH